MQEYYAPYPESNGDILLLGMQIAKVRLPPPTSPNATRPPLTSPLAPPQIFRNALPPHAPNLTLTVSDTYGFVHSDRGNLAAGRQRVALFGSLEPVAHEDEEEVERCRRAYLAGA